MEGCQLAGRGGLFCRVLFVVSIFVVAVIPLLWRGVVLRTTGWSFLSCLGGRVFFVVAVIPLYGGVSSLLDGVVFVAVAVAVVVIPAKTGIHF